MTDQEALLAAILAEPDEDTPRLAYADWLDENGQPDRAAFVRAQIEAARAEPFSKQARAAQKQSDELLEKNRDAWTDSIRDRVQDCDFGRGFVEHVTAGAFGFRENASALFDTHPIRSLRLVAYDDPFYNPYDQHAEPEFRPSLVPILTELPCLSRLRRLGFAPRTEFLDDEYEALAKSPHLAGLTDLSFANCPIQPPRVRSMLEGESFPALAGLDVEGDTHLRDCLTAALPLANHRQLRRLDVSGVSFNSDQLQKVLGSRCLKQVEELRLRYAPRDWEDGPLSRLTVGWVLPWDRLVVLDLANQGVGDEGVHGVVSNANPATLKWLGLAKNHLSRDAVRLLVGSKHLKLNYLDVRGNNTLTAADVAELKQRFPDAEVVDR
jgi:uncharacterized protein (TIGR02996 family)